MLNIQSTCEPSERLPFNEWARYINQETLLGQAAVAGLSKDPAATIRMIRESFYDNPVLIRNIFAPEILNQII